MLKAVDVFRSIESMAFTRESSDLFDRPSLNLGRILGGDAVNKVPDSCCIDVDIRYLPGQDPAAIQAEIEALPDVRVVKAFKRDPIHVERDNGYVQTLAAAIATVADIGDKLSIGRDGTSDAISFIDAGVPAVEFGPVGGGHHGPEEWVSIASLEQCRRAIVQFVHLIPQRLGGEGENRGLRIA